MTEKYGRQMKKGVLDMLVLKLLSEEPKYGYQLIIELQERSEGIFSLKEGTLYPVLYRLEEEKLVVSNWSEPEGKQVPRKYYAITETGQQALTEIMEVWQMIGNGVSRILEEKK